MKITRAENLFFMQQNFFAAKYDIGKAAEYDSPAEFQNVENCRIIQRCESAQFAELNAPQKNCKL